MSGLYDQVCNLFIRPARQSYSEHDLGSVFIGQHGIRQNFSFTSHKGFDIKASFFRNKNSTGKMCIIYLHSFNGSRLQSLRYVEDTIEKGFNFCSFDFAGCGNSGGQYVTLGCNEQWDVLKLIESLKNKFGMEYFFIWGRSMGAVTAIKFNNLLKQEQKQNRLLQITLLGFVLDSAFISLARMVVQVVQTKLSVPEFLIKAIFIVIGSSIEERAGFKTGELELSQEVQSIRCSTLLVASKQDKFVKYNHSLDIFARLKIQDKQIQFASGEHSQAREQKITNSIYTFFQKNRKKFLVDQSNLRLNAIKINRYSVEKPSKSLKKYQPNMRNNSYIKIIDQNIGSNLNFQQFNSTENQKNEINEFQTPQYKKSVKSSSNKYRQYQTEQTVQQSISKLLFSDNQKKQTLRMISKQSLRSNIFEGSKQLKERKYITKNQGNHTNIISEKLYKKGKNQRQKFIIFKDRNEQHINNIKFLNENQKMYFPSNNVSTPILNNPQTQTPNRLHIFENAFNSESMNVDKPKIINSINAISSSNKNLKNNIVRTQLKIREDLQIKQCGKVKSMTNLIAIAAIDRRQKFTLKKCFQE